MDIIVTTRRESGIPDEDILDLINICDVGVFPLEI